MGNVFLIRGERPVLDISSESLDAAPEEYKSDFAHVPSPWHAGYRRAIACGDSRRFLVEMELALLVLKHPALGAKLEHEDIEEIKWEISRQTCEWVKQNHGNVNLEGWATMLLSRYSIVGDVLLENDQGGADGFTQGPLTDAYGFLCIVEDVTDAFDHFGGDYRYMSPEDCFDTLLNSHVYEVASAQKRTQGKEGNRADGFEDDNEEDGSGSVVEEVAALLACFWPEDKAVLEANAIMLRKALEDRDEKKRAMERFDEAMRAETSLPSWYMDQKRRLAADLAKADLEVDRRREELNSCGGSLLELIEPDDSDQQEPPRHKP